MVKERETLSEYEAGRYQRQLPFGAWKVRNICGAPVSWWLVLEDWERLSPPILPRPVWASFA